MTTVFVDTSAVLALLNPDDELHPRARQGFSRLESLEATLVTSSYVLVETYALLARRFGLEAVRSFRDDFVPLVRIVWVDHVLHEKGLDLLLRTKTRNLSLVDAVSFVLMRENHIDRAFALDAHFDRAGFSTVS